jgi:ADP-ribosylglycohydrolase
MDRADAAAGCLLGTAVGDALGLPCEGLSRRRQQRLGFDLSRYSFVLDRGMCSDDTDHACMVAQALAASAGVPRRFAASLAWRLRFWLAALPAGVGFATLRAILRLWLFVPPPFAGVRSAGNGPAMRSALLGVAFADDEPLLLMHVSACTTITHRDVRAECGALAVALAARSALRGEGAARYLVHLRRLAAPFGAAGGELVGLVERAAASVDRAEPTEAFAAAIGCGKAVSGYMYHSVPVALHAWLAHPLDLEAALAAAIRCGGDTDSVGAITGAIVGAGSGAAGIPAARLERLWDWPRGVRWIEGAGRNAITAVDSRTRRPPLYLAPWNWLARNLFFLAVVLGHGFRRLLPPY